MKKVTLIITTYNAKEYLINQIKLLRELEDICKFIVIDDNSNDNSLECFRNKIENTNIKDLLIIKNEKNIGLVSSRKKAIQKVDTDFFIFLDVDDIINPKIFKLLVNKLTNKILVPWRIICDYNGDVINVNKSKTNKTNYFLKSYYGFWGIFIPKNMFYDNLLIDDCNQGEDINIFTLLADNDFDMFKTKYPLYYHLKWKGTMSDYNNWNVDEIKINRFSIYNNQLNVLNNINEQFYDEILVNFIRRNGDLLKNKKFIDEFVISKNQNKKAKRQIVIYNSKNIVYKIILILFSPKILSIYLYMIFNNEIKTFYLNKILNLLSIKKKKIIKYVKETSNFFD